MSTVMADDLNPPPQIRGGVTQRRHNMARRWYAVQTGREDLACGTGSHSYRTALKMAEAEHSWHPDEEVRIVWCTDDSDFAENVEIIYPEV